MLRAWRKEQAQSGLPGARRAWTRRVRSSRGGRLPVLPDYICNAFGKAQAACGESFHGWRSTSAPLPCNDAFARWSARPHREEARPRTSVTLNVYADVIPDDDGRPADVLASCGERHEDARSQNVASAPATRLATRANVSLTSGNSWWGGWDSNPRPRDYESPALTG